MRAGLPLEEVRVLFCLFAVNLLVWLYFLRRRGGGRHDRYQKQAQRVLDKLPLLGGDGQQLSYLRKINPYVFEELLLTAFKRQGYRIKRNKRYSGDGGLDGQVWRDKQRYLIQAKRYSGVICPSHIVAFGHLARRERCRGLFIHTGRTGSGGKVALSLFPEVELISGQKLIGLLRGTK
ncbi:restriction endonuclease [Buttiauxella noackiae]|uniref:restriction endonuclease n=1 Tax=Buttiauxella noackiae TaxID=82992 RepID=UPI0035A621C1